MKTWRDHARPIIALAIAEAQELGMDEKEMKRFISSKYPYGERAMHPYKIWCNEVRVQLGLVKSGKVVIESVKTIKPLAGQLEMFVK